MDAGCRKRWEFFAPVYSWLVRGLDTNDTLAYNTLCLRGSRCGSPIDGISTRTFTARVQCGGAELPLTERVHFCVPVWGHLSVTRSCADVCDGVGVRADYPVLFRSYRLHSVGKIKKAS